MFSRITVSGILEESNDCSVSGKTPVEWIIDR